MTDATSTNVPVSGGNVGVPTPGSPTRRTIGWNYINARGNSAHEYNYWLQDAIKQGAVITKGSYVYDRRRGILRCLNLHISGPKDLIDALDAIMKKV